MGKDEGRKKRKKPSSCKKKVSQGDGLKEEKDEKE